MLSAAALLLAGARVVSEVDSEAEAIPKHPLRDLVALQALARPLALVLALVVVEALVEASAAAVVGLVTVEVSAVAVEALEVPRVALEAVVVTAVAGAVSATSPTASLLMGHRLVPEEEDEVDSAAASEAGEAAMEERSAAAVMETGTGIRVPAARTMSHWVAETGPVTTGTAVAMVGMADAMTATRGSVGMMETATTILRDNDGDTELGSCLRFGFVKRLPFFRPVCLALSFSKGKPLSNLRYHANNTLDRLARLYVQRVSSIARINLATGPCGHRYSSASYTSTILPTLYHFGSNLAIQKQSIGNSINPVSQPCPRV
jgi:hypothetical protein